MKTRRTLFVCSMLLNFALAGMLAMVWLDGPGAPVHGTRPQGEKLALVARPQADLRVVTETAVLTNAVPLDWRSVESPDYKQYIANLKAAGCPRETIKDIIIADVNRLYAPKIAALSRPAGRPPYWVQPDRRITPNAFENAIKLRELQREKSALIEELLGVTWAKEYESLYGSTYVLGREFDFLPKEKAQAVSELRRKFMDMRSVLMDKTGGYTFQADKLKLQQMNEDLRKELTKILTPEELIEYDLRTSDAAIQVRYQLQCFNPTEEEFRQIVKLRHEYDQDFGRGGSAIDRNDPQARERMEAAEKAMEENIKTTLGPERYEEYIRAQDQDYQVLSRIAERFSSPPGAATKAWEMKSAVEKEVNNVRRNRELTPEERKETLAAIAQETERSFKEVLGGDGYRNFRAWDRFWWERMAQ